MSTAHGHDCQMSNNQINCTLSTRHGKYFGKNSTANGIHFHSICKMEIKSVIDSPKMNDFGRKYFSHQIEMGETVKVLKADLVAVKWNALVVCNLSICQNKSTIFHSTFFSEIFCYRKKEN